MNVERAGFIFQVPKGPSAQLAAALNISSGNIRMPQRVRQFRHTSKWNGVMTGFYTLALP